MIKLLITDCDGTLVDGSVVLQFATFLIKKGIIEDSITRIQWENNQKDENYIAMYGEHFKNSLKGLDYFYIDSLAEEFVKENILKYYNKPLEILNKAKKDNYMCMIISGSCDFLIEKIANHLGIFGYGAIYELENNKFTGKVSVPTYSYKVKKELIENMINPNYTDYVIGMGDTPSDISIAEYSDEFYLVQPNENTLQQYTDLQIDYTII